MADIEPEPQLVALEHCLTICGFTTQADRNKIVIHEGINSLSDIGLLSTQYSVISDKDIVSMAREAAGRRTEPALIDSDD